MRKITIKTFEQEIAAFLLTIKEYLFNNLLLENKHNDEITQIGKLLTNIFEYFYVEPQISKKVTLFLKALPDILEIIKTDLEAIFEGDPAASSKEEIILCYPGFKAIWIYRIAHQLNTLEIPLIPRVLTEEAHRQTGIDIHPGASIGHHFFIDHGTGIVIGETSIIGNYVKIYHGVTLGALSLQKGKLLQGVKRHPTIGNNVVIYASASIFGGETLIGDNSIIGSNVTVTSPVPNNSKIFLKCQI